MTKYQWTDPLGNTQTLIVRDDGRVLMYNQHRINMALSNVAFMVEANGDAAATAIVRNAARKGLLALRQATKLDWKQISE